MIYSIYDKYTGKIERVVTCSLEAIKLQFNAESQNIVVGNFSDVDFYIEGGVPKAIGLSPSKFHVFDYTIKQWVDPRTPETEWPLIRTERDRRLAASDWTQLPDVSLATKEAWTVYRQALRDVTLQPDPFNIVWPTPPA
jgi:Phage tail assembly chaperone protein